jgi:hypothetical protein
METRGRRAGHLGEGRIGDIRRPGQLRGAEACRLLRHEVELVGLHSAQNRRGAVARGADDDEVAESFEQVFDEATRILAGLDDAVYRGERGRGIPGTERVDDLAEQGTVRVPEQCDSALVLHQRALGAGDELVEK